MLEILDTAGQEGYTALRDQWILEAEGIVLVYSISSRSSFSRISKFVKQVRRVKDSVTIPSPNHQTPIFLVGNKCDRVTEREVSTQEGHATAKELGCEIFVESSAKNCINIETAFYDVVRILRRQRPTTTRGDTTASSAVYGAKIYSFPAARVRAKLVGRDSLLPS
jgi:GTPase KRas protein